MNRVRIPRHRPVHWPRWMQRLARAMRRATLRMHIRQLYCTLTQEAATDRDPVHCHLLEARLVELRCELALLEMQR